VTVSSDDGGALVGLDLGTSGLKVVALGDDGQVLARSRSAYATSRPEPGAAEQSPSHWWAAATGAVRELAVQVRPERWRGIALSGMLPTLVALDAAGSPVTSAITWQDARSEAPGAELRARIGAQELYRRTGQWVDGRYLLPMMAALAIRDPVAAGQARYLCGAKDYLFSLLTGELLTDPSTATGYGCYDLNSARWDAQVVAAAGDIIATGVPQLPEVLASTTARPLRADAASELGLPVGLPVVLGAADSVLGGYGLGVSHPGDIAYIAGTSTVILGCRDTAATDEQHRFLVTPMADAGYAAEMDLLATGSAMAWLATLLGLGGVAELADLAQQVEPSRSPVFLPYLAPGEQGALWDPDLTGALLGVTLSHGPADVARALQTGIVIESARCVAVLEQASGAMGPVTAPQIRAGGAASPAFARDLADATGRAVLISPGEPDHSAVGAARLAGLALGQDLADAGLDAVLVSPVPARRQQWDDLFAAHESARVANVVRR
jgi:sugar (pentulose or hexulose) kinase